VIKINNSFLTFPTERRRAGVRVGPPSEAVNTT
jgi:hypothetical protein